MTEGLSMWEDIKWQWRNGGMLVKLIMLNLVIWLVMILVKLFVANIAQQTELYLLIRNQFVLPSSLSQILYRPLSWLTHMFYHEGFMHILFNLLWLFTFGKIFVTFLEERRLLPVYLLSGFSGAALYILIAKLLPHFVVPGQALGSSAAIMGIVFAGVAMSPNYQLHFPFIGAVKIKWIAVVFVVFDIVGMSAMNNVGGSVAHLGGALFGYLFVQQLHKGSDLSAGLQGLLGRKTERSSKQMKVVHRQPVGRFPKDDGPSKKQREELNEQRLNEILEKISKKSFDKLSKSERDFLERYHKEN